jgi:two-component system sensor histidine kinase CreC
VSIRLKILLGYVVTFGLGLYFLFDWFSRDLEPRYREATEEPLVDTAHILAAVVGESWQGGRFAFEPLSLALDKVRHETLHAQIFGFSKSSIDLRVYVTDAKGKVIFDSEGKDTGKDYSGWIDVSRTLQGHYGARTSKDPESSESVLFVAAPIAVDGRIEGVLTVAKPTHNTLQLVERARWKLMGVAVLAVIILLLTANFVSWMVGRPIGRLTAYVRALKAEKHPPPPRLPRGELMNLKNAFQELRETLEGRRYIETYVQTVTHEIKSPLSGIRGAAELLRESPPPEDRERFLANILTETGRIQTLIDNLLQLSSLEARRGSAKFESVSARAIADEAVSECKPRCEQKQIAVETAGGDARFPGEPFWIKEALGNLLQNAIEFTPAGGKIAVRVIEQRRKVLLSVENSGSSIPEYAAERLFEPFYSLKRPDTGRKSSGLGLTIVRQVMEHHTGEVWAENLVPDGVRVTMAYPKGPKERASLRAMIGKLFKRPAASSVTT